MSGRVMKSRKIPKAVGIISPDIRPAESVILTSQKIRMHASNRSQSSNLTEYKYERTLNVSEYAEKSLTFCFYGVEYM